MRWFYKTNGRRRKVTNSEYARFIKIQRKAIERHGKEVWQTRTGRQISVTPDRLKILEEKRETAKRAGRIGWDIIRRQKEAGKIARKEDLRIRRYPGPSMIVKSTKDLGKFHAMLADYAMSALKIDGRMGRLLVLAEIESEIATPSGIEPGTIVQCSLFTVRDQVITRADKAEVVECMRPLLNGVKGLERYPRTQLASEVVPGKIVKGPIPDDTTGPRFAEKGYSAYYTSSIEIRGVRS